MDAHLVEQYQQTHHLVEQLVKVGKVKALGLVQCDQLQQPMDPNLSQKTKWNILEPPQYWQLPLNLKHVLF